jgi:hypothetical protein
MNGRKQERREGVMELKNPPMERSPTTPGPEVTDMHHGLYFSPGQVAGTAEFQPAVSKHGTRLFGSQN